MKLGLVLVLIMVYQTQATTVDKVCIEILEVLVTTTQTYTNSSSSNILNNLLDTTWDICHNATLLNTSSPTYNHNPIIGLIIILFNLFII